MLSRGWLSFTVSIGLLTSGILLLTVTVVAPDFSERVSGEIRIVTQSTVERVSGVKYPTVRLGGVGKRELDACGGSFVEMNSYRSPELPPVFAAHNHCGGDRILKLKIHDLVKVKDQGLFQVVEVRHTRKVWSSTSELFGMRGDFILQSCFYGRDKMKFVGLVPADLHVKAS